MNQVEKCHLTPIEQELAFVEYCEKNGIKMIISDADDSLWKIRDVFIKRMEEACNFLENATGRSEEDWMKLLREVNDRMYESMGVNPKRWEAVMAELAKARLLGREEELGALEILMKIYKTVPEMMPGTIEGLEFIKRCEIPLAIVTHANEEWTWWKFNMLELGRYLPYDRVSIIGEDGHKTATEWRKAFRYQGVEPRNVLLFGDSPRSDINPCIAIGVEPRNCCLIQDGGLVWSVQQQEVDVNVRTVSSLGDIRWLGTEIIHRR